LGAVSSPDKGGNFILKDGQVSLRLYLFGPFRVVVEGRELREADWTRRKAASLVKLLAFQPHRRMHREKLAETLYPELEPKAATENLHRMVYEARRSLEPDLRPGAKSRFIAVAKQQILLTAPHGPSDIWIDLEEFEQRAAAALKSAQISACEEVLALYGGELLPGDDYDDWVLARRELTTALFHELLHHTARLYTQSGALAEAIECYRRLTTHVPTDEQGHREMMRLFAQTGDHAQAERQYQFCLNALERFLSVKPQRETIELREQIAAAASNPQTTAVFSQDYPSKRVAAERRGPDLRQLTLRHTILYEAKCQPNGAYFICSARWKERSPEIYSMAADVSGWRSLGLGDAMAFAVSQRGEVAFGLRRRFLRGYVSAGTLALLFPSRKESLREVLDDVQWADFSPGGKDLLVVRELDGRNRIEYPIGQVRYETGGWVSHPRFSPNGEWIAFIDHPIRADDRGIISVINLRNGEVQAVNGGWSSVQGLAWSSAGDEILFTAAVTGNARALWAVNLAGARRFIYRGPGCLTLHDSRFTVSSRASRASVIFHGLIGRSRAIYPPTGASCSLQRQARGAVRPTRSI
jgi:DNA-binding SARP family transcriptional activator